MKRLILISIVVFVIIYFQYININKISDDFTILQYKNPSKDIFEKMLFEKKITILTDLQFNTIQFNNQSIMMITLKKYNMSKKIKKIY